MKKQQQWTLLFKVFFSKTTLNPPLINSSSSSSSSSTSYNIARPFCSLATTNKKQQQQLHMRMLLEKKKLPLLIVPYNNIGSDGSSNKKKKEGKLVWDDTLGFISIFHGNGNDDDLVKINNNKAEIYKLYLPEIADRRICGSSEGWLVTVHENGEIQLLNPFSKVLVHLPPLTAFPVVVAKFNTEEIVGDELVPNHKRGLCYLVDEADRFKPSLSCFVVHGSHHFRDLFLGKVVTNTTTTTTIDANSTTSSVVMPTVVMAIYGGTNKLAFCRPTGNGIDEKNKWISCLEVDPGGWQDEEGCWHDRGWKDPGGWEDVTFYKGNFYAVSVNGYVVVVKGLDGPSPFLETIMKAIDLDYTYMNYLVESSSSSSSSGAGDLLLVMRDLEMKDDEEEERPYITIGFGVLKLDFNTYRWTEVTNLGEDCALFIGYNHSFSFSASKFPGCRGNCIYFTDNLGEKYNCCPTGGHDIGVYNLEDGSVERLNYETSSSQLFMPPPIWYVPN